jgi:hypothetical protein
VFPKNLGKNGETQKTKNQKTKKIDSLGLFMILFDPKGSEQAFLIVHHWLYWASLREIQYAGR